jgi:replication-associated recombination protein RarA
MTPRSLVYQLTGWDMQYGAPGSGKTSIIHSLAGELGLDIYIISLSRSGLDDNGLNELISDLPGMFYGSHPDLVLC